MHSLQQRVYHLPGQAALAIFVQQPVQEEMEVICTGTECIRALRLAKQRLVFVRIVSKTGGLYTYHGVWIVASIAVQSKEQVVVSMLQMPDSLCV